MSSARKEKVFAAVERSRRKKMTDRSEGCLSDEVKRLNARMLTCRKL